MNAADLAGAAGFDASATGGDPAGGDPADSGEFRYEPERTIEMVARVLAGLHGIEVPCGTSPELRPADLVHRARAAVAAGSCPRSLAYAHMDPQRLLEVLVDGCDEVEGRYRPVVTHGRPALARFRGRGGELVGIVDWRHAAVSDPYRDLAVVAQDVAGTLGPMLVPVLIESYTKARPGAGAPDPRLLDWYALAAQFAP